MAFNSQTYRANRHRKQAWAELAQAREIKARVATSEAYEWEIPRIALYAKLAHSSMRLYLLMRRA